MEEFSIIVPVYNNEKYLRQCLDSIRSQTFSHFEVILVDDGSADNSGKICDEYAEQDERFRVIHQSNSGVTRARKTGIQNAKNEYIAWVDSDDYIGPDLLENLHTIIEEYAPDMIAFDYQRVKDDGSVLYIVTSQIEQDKYYRTSEPGFYNPMLYDRSRKHEGDAPVNPLDYGLCGKAIKREKIVECMLAMPDDVCIGEDMGVLFATLCKCDSLYVSSMCAYFYRLNESSLTGTFRRDDLRRKRHLFDYLYRNASRIPQENIDTYAFGHIVLQCTESIDHIKSYREYVSYMRSELTPDICAIIKSTKPYPMTSRQRILFALLKTHCFMGFWLIFHTRRKLLKCLKRQ